MRSYIQRLRIIYKNFFEKFQKTREKIENRSTSIDEGAFGNEREEET